jgi:hypothetical protein
MDPGHGAINIIGLCCFYFERLTTSPIFQAEAITPWIGNRWPDNSESDYPCQRGRRLEQLKNLAFSLR